MKNHLLYQELGKSQIEKDFIINLMKLVLPIYIKESVDL